MTGNHGGVRFAAMFGLLLLSIGVGVVAYNAGLAHGLAQIAPAASAAAPYPYAYGWHPFWGFGFGFPLLFIFFWIFVSRLLWWGGPWRRGWYGYGRHGCYGGPYDAASGFDEWHRRAHDRMKETPPADDPGRGR